MGLRWWRDVVILSRQSGALKTAKQLYPDLNDLVWLGRLGSRYIKPVDRKVVWVRLPPSAPFLISHDLSFNECRRSSSKNKRWPYSWPLFQECREYGEWRERILSRLNHSPFSNYRYRINLH